MSDRPSLRILPCIALYVFFSQVVTTLACAHRSSNDERPYANPMTTALREESDDLAFVLNHIESDFRKLPTEHHDEIERSQELENWLYAIARLSPAELSQAHSAFESRSIRSPFIKQHWKLLVRDENSWRSYHSSALGAGATTLGIMSFLIPICPTLPSELTRELLREAGLRYSKLMKNTNPRQKKLSPRRYADGSIRCLLRPAEWIQANLNTGAPLLKVYDLYRTLLKEVLFEGQEDYATYTSADVLRVSQALQRWFVSFMPQEADSGGTLILMGSFPNFKANVQSSDLDLVSRGMRKLTSSETTKIRDFLLQEGLGSLALPVNADTFANDWQHSRVNPVTIRISQSDIRLQVYPTLPYTSSDIQPSVDQSLAAGQTN